MQNNVEQKIEIAVFGGGCFWCTEAVFKKLRGVIDVLPGYAGDSLETATYERVSSGATKHAEVINIKFDPQQIKFQDLLAVFFATHNPTTPNRQGADVGTQYRSVIFYGSDEQLQQAQNFIASLTKDQVFEDPIVTTLEPLDNFYEAEEYHKDYYQQNQNQPYCQLVINPKLKKLKEKFSSLIKDNE
ncbi:MAG: peptide-methionine (S)-S-oxide reductase MsrA [Candidatus Doudnabacteria bacterium]